MLKSVAPGLLIDCGWPYKTQPEKIHIAPSGIRTLGDSRCRPPYGADRICALFLAEKVREGRQIVRGTARELTEWFGVDWRPASTMTRLRRVVSCWIERPNGRGGYERLRLADRFWQSGDEFELIVTREFLREIEKGAPYSLDIARRFGTQPAILDLYLWQMRTLRQGGKRREWDPYEILPAPRSRTKRLQLLRERTAIIAQVWPECPFGLNWDGKALIYIGTHRKAAQQRQAERAAVEQAPPFNPAPPTRDRAPARPGPGEPERPPWFYASDNAGSKQPTEPERPPWLYTSDKAGSKQSTEPERPPWFYTSDKARSKQPADFGVFVFRPGRNAPKNSGEQRKSIVRPVMSGQGKRKP